MSYGTASAVLTVCANTSSGQALCCVEHQLQLSTVCQTPPLVLIGGCVSVARHHCNRRPVCGVETQIFDTQHCCGARLKPAVLGVERSCEQGRGVCPTLVGSTAGRRGCGCDAVCDSQALTVFYVGVG